MQVSAIPANSFVNYRLGGNSLFLNGKNFDYISFNSLWDEEPEGVGNGDSQVLDSINDWKNFCHKQIANGYLDVIA